MTKLKTWGMPAFHLVALAPLLIVLAAAGATVLGLMPTLAFLGSTAIMTDAAMWAFTLMLAMTPITILTGWRWTQPLKKPLGLYAFMYSTIHFLIFSSAFNFALGPIFVGATANAMLLFGTIGLFLMLPLALTSNRWSMRKLRKNWKRLHYLTYVAAIAIILHLFFLGEGLGFALLYTVLLALRLPPIRRRIVGWRTGRNKRVVAQPVS